MKTIGRILIILVVFFIVAGLMIIAVNSSGTNAPDFNGAPQFRPDGTNVELRPERGERERDFGGIGLFFGPIKNIIVVGFLVTAIVLPKNAAKRKKKTAAVITANGKS